VPGQTTTVPFLSGGTVAVIFEDQTATAKSARISGPLLLV
jgi:hypothetical protein